MSKLEELIEKLCPNGVEFKELQEICNVSIGEFVHKNKQREDAIYPVFNGGISNTGFYDEYNNEGNKVLVSARGANAGFVNKIETRYWAGNSCYSIAVKDNEYINWLYVYYFLKNNEKNLLGQQQTGSIPAISKKQIESFKIAVPPLEVQCEIVHILDDFTLLSAELSAELKARQQQYDYYVEKLISSVESNNVTIGDACEIVTDYVAAGSFADIAKNVKYLDSPNFAQLVRTVDIKNKFKKADYIYVDENAFNYLWRVNLDQEAIILPNIGVNCGEVYYLTPNDLIYKNNVLGPNAILLRSQKNNNKFLSYVFKTNDFQKKLRKIISPAGQTKFNKTELKKIQIKLPSRDIQDEIADKIEKMDKLCNDISEGIPAEIEARQKQYEYYRDKLLTFKELKVEN